ncbi:MAG TPA: ABC transporter permease [Bacteroidales bacterium]|nr:ABC transporter permease [Bacteroidales bacterium]
MKQSLFNIIKRSLLYYRLPALYQFIVIMLLAAIITGSLLTGSSVRRSLRMNSEERLGNTGLVVSSGVRYFPASLADRMEEFSGTPCVAITELSGWARNFAGGETALNCQVTGAGDDFFIFNNPSSQVSLKRGEAVINSKLSGDLNVGTGDEIIVRFGSVSDIPADSPFSAEESSYESLILVVSHILEDESPANFSLAINQIKPKNIFIHRDDLKQFFTGDVKANRLLLGYDPSFSPEQAEKNLRAVLLPTDIGLNLRKAEITGQFEFISDRIFIDEELVSEITHVVPGASPVITYLSNSISSEGRSAPYSFVSALPDDLYDNVPTDDGVIINRWLAEDLGAAPGDTLDMTYYVSGPFNKLEEESNLFVISGVVEMEGIWGDAALMPEFPGITGRETCSRWEAGVPVNMDDIRQKDEDYWYSYRGTPKAFIGYERGKAIWGNNFGPATSIRFPVATTDEDIMAFLQDQIDPLKNGFRIIDARGNAIEAASNSVDFSALFLSLGFFIIISSLVLLSLIVSTYFESRKEHIKIMRAIGFRSRLIKRILFFETAPIALFGSLAGIFAGELFNRGVISALNSVWRGAVQTDTLSASMDIQSLLTGFIVTLVVTLLVLLYKSDSHLKRSAQAGKSFHIKLTARHIQWLLIVLVAAATAMFTTGLLKPGYATSLFFAGGAALFIGSLLLYYIILRKKGRVSGFLKKGGGSHSWLYYAYYPTRAITPILFIAAGLFIVVATGANRKSFDTDLLSRESGTGGWLLWGETATPLTYDLNSEEGRNEYGISDHDLSGMEFIQARIAVGDDASCLNLNQVTTPPLLGLDVSGFSRSNAFTFVTWLKELEVDNPWDALEIAPDDNIIYGIVDQTVLQWGLKRKVGDTITVATESGEPLHIIVAGGLAASVFQGYIIIGNEAFTRYLPSVAGSNIFLVDGNPYEAARYKQELTEILSPYGTDIKFSWDRLAEFNQVSNTYLTVFMTLGGFGMLLGVIGLAFILLRNFNLRKKEFALLLATGYTPKRIRRTLFREHFMILSAGIISGSVPAILATLPSLSSSADIPLLLLIATIAAIFSAGTLALILSARSLISDNLVDGLRKD